MWSDTQNITVGRPNCSQTEEGLDYVLSADINEKAKQREVCLAEVEFRSIMDANTGSVILTPSHEETALRSRWGVWQIHP